MINIMVDSSSDCADSALYDYFVPISITMNEQEYHDGIDLSRDAFYTMLISSKDFPKTSQPSPQSYMDIFNEVKTNGDELVYLSLSSALSGTYQSAVIAKAEVDYDGIHIVDTKTATHCIHLLALFARKLATAGCNGVEIAEKCSELRSRIRVLGGLDTLEYLYRGGRLNRASAVIGEIANIKPLVTVSLDGRVENIAKAIGVPRAIQTIIGKVASFEIDQQFPVWSLCTVQNENCEKLEQALEKNGISVTDRLQVGPTIGAHLGPGLYGVLFVSKE